MRVEDVMIRAVQLERLRRGKFTPEAGALPSGPTLQSRREVPGGGTAGGIERGPSGEHLRRRVHDGVDREYRRLHPTVVGMSAPRQHERVDHTWRHVGGEPPSRIIAVDGAEV